MLLGKDEIFKYGFKTDIWSIGITTYFLMTYEYFFNNSEEEIKNKGIN